MARLRTSLIATLALVSALRGAAALADSGALKQGVDAVIDAAIAEKHVVGTVVLVAQDGKIVYERAAGLADQERSEEHTSELQSLRHLVCRLLLEKKKDTAEYR